MWRCFFYIFSSACTEQIAFVNGFMKFSTSEFAIAYRIILQCFVLLHVLLGFITRLWAIVILLTISQMCNVFLRKSWVCINDNKQIITSRKSNGPQKSMWMVCQAQSSGGNGDIWRKSGWFPELFFAWQGMHLSTFCLTLSRKPDL